MTLPEAIEQRGCGCGLSVPSGTHHPWCPIQIAADIRSGALGEDLEDESPLIYRARGEEREHWCVIAHRAGNWKALQPLIVPLSPTRFPVCGNYEEVQERVRLMLTDATFRNRWKGYYITGVRVDGQVMA
jgi:hypothetical protein